MSDISALVKRKRYTELWRMCCGFLDISLDEFMIIQKRLLLEQLTLLKSCELGRRIMQGAMPDTVEEFRAQVPLTTYIDYCPELLKQQEDVLPAKPDRWIKTSGRSGEYPHKLIPFTKKFWDEAGIDFSAIAILGSCSNKGEIAFRNGFKLLHAMANPPFLTGNVALKLEEDLGFQFFPPLLKSGEMSFEERVEKGFQMAFSRGMDGFFGLAGVLVATGEKFRQGSGSIRLSQLMFQPGKLLRLFRGKIKSKLAGRPMLPSDLWSLKVIASMGTDSVVYKDRIKALWGRAPLNIYGNSETVVVATQTWDYDGMVFFPNLNFLEFIPEDEYVKRMLRPSYKPKTVLLDEVKAGKNYELVITNFHGSALVRYRLGDMIRVTALKNDKLGIALPQIVFERRCDDLIDLGFMRLTERVLWQAIDRTGIPCKGWTARKEFEVREVGRTPVLYLYIELKNGTTIDEKALANALYEEIKKVDDGLYVYEDIESLENLIDFKPIKIILLPSGVFDGYKEHRKAEGASASHQRPPHINPPDNILSLLGAKVKAPFN